MPDQMDIHDRYGRKVGEATESGRDGFAGPTKYQTRDNYGRITGEAVEKSQGWGSPKIDLFDKQGRKVGQADKQSNSSGSGWTGDDWWDTAANIFKLIVFLWIVQIKVIRWTIQWLRSHPRGAKVIAAAIVVLFLLNLIVH